MTFTGCKTPGAAPAPAPATAGRAAPLPMADPTRAVWVARFHYRYPDDIATIMANCAQAGFNTVLWQVRGDGTVAYRSRLEPWSREYDFRDPGFDPLKLAVQEAHKRGLRIEAYINVINGWKGKTPPPMPEQLYNAHPEWFMHDAAGRQQPLGDFYVILNPCLPEVRRHIVEVVDEILTNYDVDGIHLDYVRYAWDDSRDAKRDYPRDARTLALFRRDSNGIDPDDNPMAWDNWRANQLTRLVHDIRTTVDRRRPGASLTAAVCRDPRRGYNDYLQNAVGWLRTGLLDAAMPMAYTDELAQLEADIDAYRRIAGEHPIVPGLGVYLHEQDDQMREQLHRCMQWGGNFALFSYDSLFPTAGDRGASAKTRAEKQRLRLLRRDVLGKFPRR